MLEKTEVKLISVLEPIASENTPEACLFRGIVETVNEYYSKNLGRETLKGKNIAAQSAKHLGGPIPFGYMLNERGVYTPNPEEAPIVLEIFKRLDAGVKRIDVARWLKAKGVLTRYKRDYSPEAILKYNESEPTDKAESLRLLLATFVDHIELSNKHIVIYFKFELPGLPESSSFDFVRKSTNVSTCFV